MTLIQVGYDGPVARLVLDRAEARNALTTELCDEIRAGLEAIDANPQARVILLAGRGPAFCAGADLEAVRGPEAMSFLSSFEAMLDALAHHRLPVVAALHGATLGGGLQVATVCDFRIVAEDATLGIPAARLGIVVNFENVQRLVLLVGIAGAKELLMTGTTLNGREAVNAGLAQRSVPASSLQASASAWAGEIAALAPLSVQGAKRAIGVVVDHLGARRDRDPQAVEAVDALVRAAYESRDLGEGMAARAAKREPFFEGR